MVDLNQVVRETLALRRYEQRLSNINILEAFAAGLPGVFADSHQIQQVLLNLIINAEQAMLGANGRGTLIIRTWHDPQKDAVILEVHDDGPGVPEDVQPRVFDPFFTTKEVGKGTGLGLTVAYAIVQEHAGRITLKSGPSGGASFYVELPVGSSALKPAVRAPERAPTVGSGGSVLVVEDEAALGAAVSEALADAGFSVSLASDGLEALERVKERPYDLIVCDLKMPRLDGPAFYRRLEAENAGARAPRAVRHRRRRRNRCRTVPGRDWLPLAAEAFSPERSPESRQRNAGLSPQVRGPTLSQVRGRAVALRTADSSRGSHSRLARSNARPVLDSSRYLVRQHHRRRLLPIDLRHPHPPHRLLKRQDGGTESLGRFRSAAVGAKRLAQALDGACVELRDPRFVDANLGANLFHRRFGVVVERDDAPFARRQRGDRGADAVADFLLLERLVRRRRFGRHEGGRKRRAVDVLACRQRRRRFDGRDADDGPPEPRLVRADARGQVGERGFGAELAAELLAGGFELTALAAHAARPGVAPAARRSSRRGRGARRTFRT